jgi:hypothetical protein
MAMTRVDALGYLVARTGSAYVQAQRNLTDTPLGYGPAIDAALLLIGATTDTLYSYTVPSDMDTSFQAALKYHAWDLVLNDLAMMVDQQVDAPLTNIKASQAYKMAKERRDEALTDLNAQGLGPSEVNWIKWNLDFLEPAADASRQWG